MAASTKWRLTISVSNNASYTGVVTLTMATTVGGANACVGGTASASSEFSAGYVAANAFDASPSTYWSSFAVPAWLQYDFPAPVDIAQYAVVGEQSNGTAPQAWALEYWTGTGWVAADSRTGQTGWAINEVRTFTVSAPSGAALLSQAALEVLVRSDAPVAAVLAQAALEVLVWSDAPVSARLSQLALEVLHSPLAEVVVPTGGETASTFVFLPV